MLHFTSLTPGVFGQQTSKMDAAYWKDVIHLLSDFNKDCLVIYPAESRIEELLPEFVRGAPAQLQGRLQALCKRLWDNHRFLKVPDAGATGETGRERWVKHMFALDNRETLDFMFARQEEFRQHSVRKFVKEKHPKCVDVEGAALNEAWENRCDSRQVARTPNGILPHIGRLLAYSKQVKIYDYVLGMYLMEDYFGGSSRRYESTRYLNTITTLLKQWLAKSFVSKREFEIVTELPMRSMKTRNGWDVEKAMQVGNYVGRPGWKRFFDESVNKCHRQWREDLAAIADGRDVRVTLSGYQKKMPRNRFLWTERAMVQVGKGFDFDNAKPREIDRLDLCGSDETRAFEMHMSRLKRLAHIDLS